MPLLKELRSIQLILNYKHCGLTARNYALGGRTSRPHNIRSPNDDVIKSFRASRSSGRDVRASSSYVSFFLNASFKPDWAWS